MRQVTAEDWRQAELHCTIEEDRLMSIYLRLNQIAEEEAAQDAIDEDQDQGPERAGTSEEAVSLTCGFEEREAKREAKRARSPATLRSEK